MNFGFSDDASGSSTNWLGFGRTPRNVGASSPGIIAASPNELNPDETSFAESYRPETSPLFNPMFSPQSDPLDATPQSGLTSNPVPGWDLQRDSAPVETNSRPSSPLVRDARAQSLDLSTELEKPAPVEKTDAQDPVDSASREQSLLQESAARSADDETTEAQTAEEAKQDAMDVGESGETEVQDQELGAEDAAEKDDVQGTEGQAATTESLGSQSPTSSIPNEAHRSEAEEMVVDSEPLEESQHSPSSEVDADESAIPPPSTAKRSRRNGSQMLNAAAKSIVKNIDGPRKRLSFVPWSPAFKSTPVSAKKRGRKSMPARIDAETPRKRGRPRKSDAVATPATITPGAKRGRPRKSDAALPVVTSATKTRAPPTPRQTTNIQNTPGKSSLKAVQSNSTAATPNKTPNKVGRPRKTPAKDTPSAAATETPKRRGRPPKNALQPSSAKSAVSGKDTDEALPAKRTRVIPPRVVPSPAKRGRPTRKAAAPAPKPAPASKPTTTRGRRAAVKSDSNDTAAAAAPVEPPKRRGRPLKNAAASKTKEAVAKPEPKKRGRPAATVTETATVPAPKKRGRAAQATAENAVLPEAKPRGRPKRAEPAADVPEPPAKRQRTTRGAEAPAVETPAAPARRTGRGAAKATAEKDTTTAPAKPTRSKPDAAPAAADPPKATRGRAATKVAAEKPAPKPPGRAAKSGKGELPSSKTAVEEEPPKRASGRGAAPTGVVKKAAVAKKAPAAKKAPVAAAPRRALRSRG
ncbi:hypothetical protein G7Z17_g10709 [Cylindrodendrum hubeiense]|uniref:Uncharacterized protein n=1 Tax=Cylindrodendrum hubeiense TaxID=595255 RepID=A0A9P5H1M6_9HYPO|nr:hypothetical protein G7Z17_g10709 [Cylindrodendrum hubeiense]